MISRNKKVWCALWVVLLVSVFAASDGRAQTTYTVDVANTMVPSLLPSLVPGDRVLFKIKSTYHILYMDGQPMFGGVALFSGEERLQTFSSEGTFVISDARTSGTCVITVTQPENAAPTVAITNLASNVAIPLGSNVVVRATANDEDGSIRRVLFLYGAGTNLSSVTNVIATSTAAPHTITWTNTVPGRYTLRARAYDNLEVFANSARVNLSLYTPFTNTLPAITNVSGVSNLVFRFNTDTGLVYVVEATTNLVNWTPIVTNTAAGTLIEILDPNLTVLTNRFYRIRLVP